MSIVWSLHGFDFQEPSCRWFHFSVIVLVAVIFFFASSNEIVLATCSCSQPPGSSLQYPMQRSQYTDETETARLAIPIAGHIAWLRRRMRLQLPWFLLQLTGQLYISTCIIDIYKLTNKTKKDNSCPPEKSWFRWVVLCWSTICNWTFKVILCIIPILNLKLMW